MNKFFKQRFNELEAQAVKVEASKALYESGMFVDREHVDSELLLNWKVKVRNLLSKVCGEESQHFQQFEKREADTAYTTNYIIFKGLKAIFWRQRKILKVDISCQ